MSTRNHRFGWLASAATLALAMTLAGAAEATTIYDGLAGHWKFDGDYSDASLGGNPGTVGAGTPAFASGQAGQALSVDGPSNVKTVNNLSVAGSFPRTLNLWFNAAALQTQAPVATGTDGTGGVFDLYLKSTGIYGGHFHSGGYETMLVAPNPLYSANQWVMATLVYDGNLNVDVYRNGQYEKSATMPGPLNTAATPLFFGGGGGWTGTRLYSGLVDDVALWGRPLSKGEIASVYQAGAAGTSLHQTSPLALQFDAGAGSGTASGPIGPAQALGAMTGGTWQLVTNHVTSATVVDENGASVSNVTIQFGSYGATNGSVGPITNWGTVGVGTSANTSGPGGVHSGALMTDFVYTASDRNVMGARISGLPAGTYDVFAMPRHGLGTGPFTIAMGVNIDQLAGNSFTNPGYPGAAPTTWVEGTSLRAGNVFRKRVTISGPTDNIAMLFDNVNTSSTELMGFQIAQVADPTPPTFFRVQFDAGRSVGVPYGPVGPGHAVGLFSGNEWNPLGGNYSGAVVDEFGNPLPAPVTVQFAANDGTGPLTADWGNDPIADWGGLSGLTGVNNTELMRDALYVSSGSREVMGIRVGGLPVGYYEVLMMPKYAGSTSPQSVSIGVNLNLLDGWLVSPAGPFDTWVEGTDTQAGNYYRKLVNITGPGDWITMIYDNTGYTSTEFMGFQIARVGVPEPSAWVLLSVGLAGLALSRRRPRRHRR